MCTLCRQTDLETQMYIEISLLAASLALVGGHCALLNTAWKDTYLLLFLFFLTLSCPYNILSFKGQIRPQELRGGGGGMNRGRIRPQDFRHITQYSKGPRWPSNGQLLFTYSVDEKD